jgi:alanine racemase
MIGKVIINQNNLENNIKIIKSLLPKGLDFCSVIKSNAYGHGSEIITKSLLELGINRFAVDSFEEYEQISNLITNETVFILGFTPKEYLQSVKKNCILTVSSKEQLEYYGKQLGGLRVSIKCETGTNRQGASIEDLISIYSKLNYIGAEIASIHSHLANSEDLSRKNRTSKQNKAFAQFYDAIENKGIYCHIGSSASIFHQIDNINMVRVGIAQYGLYPSGDIKKCFIEKNLELAPVLEFKSVISQIKHVEAGNFIGYGNSYRLKKNSRIGIVPVGYNDGLARSMGNKMKVLINGKLVKQVGNICMNMIMLDLDRHDVSFMDEVTLIGKDHDLEITLDDWATWQNSINYEAATNIKSHIQRVKK